MNTIDDMNESTHIAREARMARSGKYEPVKTTREEALARIEGSLSDDGKRVVYYDDSTQLYYSGPVEDLDDLADLMDSDDEDTARDAYSHWCAGCTHGDGCETAEKAEISRRTEDPTDRPEMAEKGGEA